ncbi:hypothetical protein Gotur_027968 [Gossypium turneri]
MLRMVVSADIHLILEKYLLRYIQKIKFALRDYTRRAPRKRRSMLICIQWTFESAKEITKNTSKVAPLQLNYHLERRLENLRNGKREVKLKKKPQLEWHLKNMKPKSHKYLVRNEFSVKPTTYSAKIVTDIPLYETPWALFHEYLEDKPRVFNAMFPHKHSTQQLYEDEWRIKMMPLKVVALKVWPVIDFRLKCKYPPQVPADITKLLEVQSVSKYVNQTN